MPACTGRLYRYYRNTDKSHAFERETKVEAKPVTGSDVKIGTNNGTQESRIAGDNVSAVSPARAEDAQGQRLRSLPYGAMPTGHCAHAESANSTLHTRCELLANT